MRWRDIWIFAVSVTIGYLAARSCTQPGTQVRTVRDTTTVYVTAPPDSIKIISIRERHDTITLPVDTNAIISDYRKERTYKVSAAGQDVNITAKPIVFQNRLDSISFSIQNFRATKIIQPPPKKYLSVGAIAGSHTLAPGLAYGWQRWEAGANYDLIDNELLLQINYKLWQH